MENTKEKQTLTTISFQLESKCERGLEPVITYVPKFNDKAKIEAIDFEEKYQGQVKVSLNDIKITDTYYQCVDNCLYNVPLMVLKNIPSNVSKALQLKPQLDITGVRCSISSYKGTIDSRNADGTYNIKLDRIIHYIIQD